MYWQFCSVMIWKANRFWNLDPGQQSVFCISQHLPWQLWCICAYLQSWVGGGDWHFLPRTTPISQTSSWLSFRLEIQTWCRILWESPSSSSQIVMSVREGKNLLRFWVVFFLDRDLLHFFLCLSSHNATHHYKYSETVLTRICMGRSAIYPRLIWLLKCTHHREIMLSK